MLLAIDVGNSNTVLGCFWDGKLRKMWRLSTHPLRTGDEIRLTVGALLELDGIRLDAVRSVAIASVVPPLAPALRQAFEGFEPHFIDHRSPFSFTIRVDPPSQVGADRLVNAEAVFRDYGAPAVVVDSGTATTVCALSRDGAGGAYLGGAIMPGIELSMEALTRRTAKLFAVDLAPPARAIGASTQAALQSGILFGYAEMLDGMVRRFKQELGEPHAKVVATGGVSERLRGLTKEVTHFDPELTLRGIRYTHDALRAR